MHNVKMMRIYFLLFSVIVFETGMLFAQNNNKYDELLIRKARILSNEAIAKKDTNAIADIWTEDYHLISSRNFEESGKEKNLHFFAKDITSKDNKNYIRTTLSIEVFPLWNMAAESGEWIGRWQEADGEIILKGTYYAKWHKVNDQWKIRAEIFVPLSCSGSKFCDVKPF